MTRILLSLLLLMALATCPARAAGDVFTVQSDPHLEFAREVCLEALKKAGMEAEFLLFPPGPEKRLTAELARGNLHLAFMPPNADRAALEVAGSVAAIRFPLERGLLGWRICVVREAERDMLRDVVSAEGLRRFTVGQGMGWSDIDVYRLAGIPVAESPFLAPSDLLRSLVSRQFDLLPLGIGEYLSFLEQFNPGHYPVEADRHIVLRYPWFRFVWVSKTAPQGERLLELLSRGLDIMAEDGSFLAIHAKHRSTDLSVLKGRRIIDLPSPYAGAWDIPRRYRHLLAEQR